MRFFVSLVYSTAAVVLLGDITAASGCFGEQTLVKEINGVNEGYPMSPSGIAASRKVDDTLYVISDDDSFGSTRVVVLDALNGAIVGAIDVTGVTNTDWEDVAVGPCDDGRSCIFIQDAGEEKGGPANNIIVLEEPTNPRVFTALAPNQTINYAFESGSSKHSDSTFVDTDGTIYFLGREWYGQNVVLYKLNDTTAVAVQTLTFPSSERGPEAADLSPDGQELLVRMTDRVYLYQFADGQILTNTRTELPSPPTETPHGVAWARNAQYFSTLQDNYFMHKPTNLYVNFREPKSAYGEVIAEAPLSISIKVTGIAASREYPGLVYTVHHWSDIAVIDISTEQTVSEVTLGGVTYIGRSEISVGNCPSTIGTGSCLVIHDPQNDRILVFPESWITDPTVDTTVGITSANIISYGPNVGTAHAAFTDCAGNIFLLSEADPFTEDVKVYKVSPTDGTASEEATFPAQSTSKGPFSAEVSPCCDKLLIKFKDNVVYYHISGHDVTDVSTLTPYLLSYLPEPRGYSLTFTDDNDCASYLTGYGYMFDGKVTLTRHAIP